jgi:hypothetical protein
VKTLLLNQKDMTVRCHPCLVTNVDLKLNPKHDKQIWIVKYNFLGLLRICESFELFRDARNLYEGGVIGEGIVKLLRPLTAAGMHGKWATNLLLKHYRQLTLDMLIAATKGSTARRKHCQLGEQVESCKFKRFSTKADVTHSIKNGKSLPVLLYGSVEEWKAGVIIVAQNRWYFSEISFGNGDGVLDDVYGLTYHHVTLVDNDICFGGGNEEFTTTLGEHHLSFWDYGLVLPEILREDMFQREGYRYAVIRSNWQYVDQTCEWNQFD